MLKKANELRPLVDESMARRAGGGGATPAGLLTILQNSITQTNAAQIGPATPCGFDSSAFTVTAGGSGEVKIAASLYTSGDGGATVANNDQLFFQLRRDGVTLLPPRAVVIFGPGGAGATLVWEDTVAPGSTHTYGIQAVDGTTPAATISCPANAAVIQLSEAP